MVDIHSHILFGVDDGAKNLEESLELLRQAEKAGYTDIVCSSHYYIGRFQNKNYNENFHILKEEIQKEKIKVKIYKGNEFAIDENYFFHKEDINRINRGKYLLVELRTSLIYPICRDFFKELLKREIIPVFAHVERYPHIKISEFKELYEMGVILQMNVRAAANPSPKAKYLLDKRYIGVLATDTHKIGKRDYKVSESLKKIEKNIGTEYFKILTEINPRKIIEDKKIDICLEGENYEVEKINRNCSIFSSLRNKLFTGKFFTK